MGFRRGALSPTSPARPFGPWPGRYAPGPYLGADPPAEDPGVWKEYYVISADFAGAAALAAGTANGRPSVQAFSSLSIRIDSDANFEFCKSQYVATDPRVYVQYRDETAGRYLNRGSLDLIALAGIAAPYPEVGGATNPQGPTLQPFVWPQPHVIQAASAWVVFGADYSGAQNTVRLAFHGAKVRPGRAPWDRPGARRLPYYVAIPDDSVNPQVSANATQPWSVQIDQEADFVVTKMMIVRTGAALVRILDGRDRSWFLSDQHVDNVGGNGGFPNILAAPRFLPRGSPVYGQFQDLSGANNILRMYLAGYRVFD
jgi:hypothetical protein